MSASLSQEARQRRQMDSIYRVQRHIYDLTRKYYLLGRDRLIENLQVPDGGTVLELGCGTGRNLAVVAKAYPSAYLYGVDISSEMLKSAGTTLKAQAQKRHVRLAQADAAAFDARSCLARARFDRIFISYSLSMIPDWQDCIRHAISLLAPNGQLHIVDFGQQERLPERFRKGLFRWLGLFHVTPRATLLVETERLAAELGCGFEGHSLYRGYAWMAELRKA